MDSKPDFIQHYIDQYINEECFVELVNLKSNYKKEVAKLEESSSNRNEGDRRYKEATGQEHPKSVRNEARAIDAKYKAEAKRIAHKYAEIEQVKLIDWKDKELEKSVAEKSKETEEQLEKSQEKMLSKLEEEKQSQVEKEQAQDKEFKDNLRAKIKEQLADQNKQKAEVKFSEIEKRPEQEKDKLSEEELKELTRRQLKYDLNEIKFTSQQRRP